MLLAAIALLIVASFEAEGDIFTSSDEILALANRETALLDALQNHINAEYDNLKALSAFLSDRSKATRTLSFHTLREKAEHPNGAFHLIKLYTQDWQHVVTSNPLFNRQISHLTPQLPTQNDFEGACFAIIRLQRVYKLRVTDMFLGNYSGYLGPVLQPEDAFEIGRQAFVNGYLPESCEWLQVAVDKLEEQDTLRGSNPLTLSKRGQAAGLVGRAYYFMNQTEKAWKMYEIGNRLDSSSGDVQQLHKELLMQTPSNTYGSVAEAWDANMTELCMWGKTQRVDKLKPFHICRYKTGLFTVPYVRYKEEILSTTPYASVFHNIISDLEINTLIGYVKGRMFRGLVGSGKNATTAVIRTSNLGWVFDDEMKVANTLSRRIKSMTGLEVAQRTPHGPSSSEAFQVVNYGMGGHYDVHMDPFDIPPEDLLLNRSGERLATFLIYLSDVEKGGNTAFVRSKISVAPQKGMALFWYNFVPAMQKDFETHHAGCPVLMGHKWIANKWIWTYGNTFKRPCGPSPESTQQDIEPLMYSRQ